MTMTSHNPFPASQADPRRRLVPGPRPVVPVRAPRDVQAERIETEMALGDVLWRPAHNGLPCTLANQRTRQAWTRDALGYWRPHRAPRPLPLAQVIGMLLRQPGDQVQGITVALRQDIRPWREILDAAAAEALRTGGDLSTVRTHAGRVAEEMTATQRRPHRIVLIVDDADALAASWYADAAEAAEAGPGDAAEAARAAYLRVQGERALAMGAGEFQAGEYGDLTTAVLEVAKLRDTRRPGQGWRVEPVAASDGSDR